MLTLKLAETSVD